MCSTEDMMEISGNYFFSPFHMAAAHGHLEKVRSMILKAEVDVNSKNDVNCTPLHVAAFFGHLEIVKILLEHGAAINCKTLLGSTPLHFATKRNHIDVVSYLLQHGADTLCKDEV